MVELRGGAKLEAALAKIAKNVKRGAKLRVGFFENATYDDGTFVAMVAAMNEFGGTINMPEHDVTLYRSVNKSQTEFLKGGKFVKKSKSNFATTHTVQAYTITIPPRPFFRRMIAEKSGEWPAAIGALLVANDWDGYKALDITGSSIAGQLRQSIRDFISPPLSPATIAKKGFDKPLIDSGVMLDKVTWEIEEA
jgi:hypothetical protein